ncbi:hypothetical protein NDU88_003480 [Pleurodeles waltl]|uniref:Uncharacterized protein n=1 Tax=Pleurodeles waltl TaxID=8319 RepID=A0AAV7Q944_PLEWA|nr:hypothetical protein NDU88_003480 [Pleurodeles waltl]
MAPGDTIGRTISQEDDGFWGHNVKRLTVPDEEEEDAPNTARKGEGTGPILEKRGRVDGRQRDEGNNESRTQEPRGPGTFSSQGSVATFLEGRGCTRYAAISRREGLC